MNNREIKIKECKCDYKKCPSLSNIGISVRNEAPYWAFPEMEKGQWMHLECYIRHTIEKYLKNYNKSSKISGIEKSRTSILTEKPLKIIKNCYSYCRNLLKLNQNNENLKINPTNYYDWRQN